MPETARDILPPVTRHFRVTPDVWQTVEWPAGVALLPLSKHPDERGFFMEVVRFASLDAAGFAPRQVSVSETASGVVKAFHYHRLQADLFCPVHGRFRIVLLDSRPGPTCGYGYSVYTDADHPLCLHIPAGVAHGYQVVGPDAGLMLYITSQEYNPADEYRFSWDDARIAFPWDM
jgi:dTDP-4-dehydrorhamnose 3,5-epimerase